MKNKLSQVVEYVEQHQLKIVASTSPYGIAHFVVGYFLYGFTTYKEASKFMDRWGGGLMYGTWTDILHKSFIPQDETSCRTDMPMIRHDGDRDIYLGVYFHETMLDVDTAVLP